MNNLVVSGLSKSFGNKIALNDFSFELSGGEIVGLIGRNGAGKTTLLNCLAGNIYTDKGSATVDGIKLKEVRNQIGISVDSSFVEYLSGEENLKLLEYAGGQRNNRQSKELIHDLLEIVDLRAAAKKKVSSYSYGMKQRLGFAQAILNGSKLLFLDEPLAGLDIQGRRIVKEYLSNLAKDKKIGVLFSDHNLEEVRDICDRIISIENGMKIYDGPVSRDTICYIWVNNICEEMSNILEKNKLAYDISKNLIYLPKGNDIDNVLRLILQWARINNITSEGDSLERFFTHNDH